MLLSEVNPHISPRSLDFKQHNIKKLALFRVSFLYVHVTSEKFRYKSAHISEYAFCFSQSVAFVFTDNLMNYIRQYVSFTELHFYYSKSIDEKHKVYEIQKILLLQIYADSPHNINRVYRFRL